MRAAERRAPAVPWTSREGRDPVRSTLTVCETCAFAPGERTRGGLTAGETFARLVESRADLAPDLRIRRHPCLMGCTHPCNVAVSAPGRIAYVLGGFRPDPEAAAAVLAFARLHAASPTGQVPFRLWPAGVRGHFVARLPPPDAEAP